MKNFDQQLYIKQGKALMKLLKKTDLQGAHQSKIKAIEQKLQNSEASFKS